MSACKECGGPLRSEEEQAEVLCADCWAAEERRILEHERTFDREQERRNGGECANIDHRKQTKEIAAELACVAEVLSVGRCEDSWALDVLVAHKAELRRILGRLECIESEAWLAEDAA